MIQIPKFRSIPALLFAGLLGIQTLAAQERVSPVGVDTVIRAPLAQTIPVIGQLVAVESGTVATRIAERVDAVLVQVGNRVAKNDVLAKLSTDRLKGTRALRVAELRKADASVARETANLARSEQQYRRIAALRGSTAFRKDRLDDAERDLEIARSSLSQAEAQRDQARASLRLTDIAISDAAITSPYPGVVVVRHTVAGDYVKIGDPIVTLLNDQAMEIEADVPALRTTRLETGLVVNVVLADGSSMPAAVRAVVPEENPRTRTRSVRFSLDAANSTIFAGNQAVTVQIPVGGARNVVTVHKDAIVILKGRQMIYVVKDGKVTVRPITTGNATGSRFEVLEGLKPGEVVVVRGNERLRPGQSVKPLPSG